MDAKHTTKSLNIYTHRTLASWLGAIAKWREQQYLMTPVDDPRTRMIGFDVIGYESGVQVVWEQHFVPLTRIKDYRNEALVEPLKALGMTVEQFAENMRTPRGRDFIINGITPEMDEAARLEIEAVLRKVDEAEAKVSEG